LLPCFNPGSNNIASVTKNREGSPAKVEGMGTAKTNDAASAGEFLRIGAQHQDQDQDLVANSRTIAELLTAIRSVFKNLRLATDVQPEIRALKYRWFREGREREE